MDETTAGAGAREPAPGRGTGDLPRFADLAGVRLYRRNAFAVTGLPANAQGRAVRQHRQRLEARLAIEDTWPGEADSPLVGGHRKDEVRAAFEEFQDPRRRLVDELLWRWGEADLGCECPGTVHEEHDQAVRFHAMALEAEDGRIEATEEGRDTLWRGAASTWGTLLERPEFRDHIAHRIRALDDPRLRNHSADYFLAGIPRLLVSPLTEIASGPGFAPRLARVCAGWAEYEPFSDLFSELFEETVDETERTINDGLRSAEDKREAGQYGDAVVILREKVLADYHRLDSFREFVSEWRHEQVAHSVAVALNNLAVALQHHHMVKPPTAKQRKTVVELAEKAYEIAPDRDAEGIKENWSIIYDQFTGSGHPAVARGFPWKKAVLILGGAIFVVVMSGVLWGPAVAVGIAVGLFYMIGSAW
ncbi:hypothetical protein ACIRQP_24040 [Streptomyces sp. NPDC102274]|uniref:hypothetical protein n=1 Tax=Streptomyces sp. NPDC102274 TaxID=3366151 RepID=UPI003800DE28